MLKIVEDKHEIQKAQKRLQKVLKPFFKRRSLVKIGYQGGSFEGEAYWSDSFKVWVCFEQLDNRFWNGFGIQEPIEGSSVSIACEINIPLSGVRRNIIGAFATDDDGNLYIVHRGVMGGSKKGVNKALFFDNYRGTIVKVEDGGKETEVALIGDLNSPLIANQVVNFIFEVSRIKGLHENDKDNKPKDVFNFNGEFSGRKEYSAKNIIKAQCNHGLIVNKLYSKLRDVGFKVANDRNKDLFIFNSQGKIKVLFEVKTDILTSSLYSAVGQLFIYSATLTTKPKLVVVIPEGLLVQSKRLLKSLGISVLEYKIAGDQIIFINFKKILLRLIK